MPFLVFLALLFLPCASFAQLTATKLNKTTLPRTITYQGHLRNAVRWTDSIGTHIVVTTETGEMPSKDLDDASYRDAALYAYQYRQQGTRWKLEWKVADFVHECPVDLRAAFTKNSFAVTDLGHDQKAEVWLMYKTVCHGDVSPSTMKIIVYEDQQKYAVRGTNQVKVSATEYLGGDYTFDEAFQHAPAVWKQYALRLWKKNLVETWEEER